MEEVSSYPTGVRTSFFLDYVPYPGYSAAAALCISTFVRWYRIRYVTVLCMRLVPNYQHHVTSHQAPQPRRPRVI